MVYRFYCMALFHSQTRRHMIMTVPRPCFFVDPFLIYVSCLSCFLVCSLQPCGHLLGKGWPLCFLVCDVFLCFVFFPMWCPGSGVVLDCIDSWSLPSSLSKKIITILRTKSLLIFLFVWFEVLAPSQQLWPCQDCQFT